MAIKIGDAVIDLLFNTANLDQVLSQLGADIPQKLAPAQESAAGIGRAFDVSAKSATVAGTGFLSTGDKAAAAGKTAASGLKGTDEATQGLINRVKILEAEIVALQQKIDDYAKHSEDAGRKAAESYRLAAAEAGLLGEATGVRLPRHVRTFIGELPGVSSALSAAFEATAILFIIEAVVQLGEKVEEFLEKPGKVAEAWKNVSDSTLAASRDMTRALDESGAKIIGLTEGPLAELDFKIKNIGTDSAVAAAAVGKIGDSVTAALDLQKANAFSVAFFGGFKETSRDVADDAKKFFADIKTEAELSTGGALDSVNKKLESLDLQIRATQDDLNKDQSASGQHFYQDRIDALDRYRTSLLATQKVLQDGVDQNVFEKEAEGAQRAETADNERATTALQNAKNVLDARLAAIEQTKAGEQAAFADGKITADQWAQAQIKAANDSANAQVAYKNAIASSAAQSLKAAQAEAAHAQQILAAATNDANRFALDAANEKVAEAAAKARAVAEDAANERVKQNSELLSQASSAIIKAQTETQKLRAEWDKVDFGSEKAADADRALDSLTRAELRLAQAAKTIEESRLQADFSRQEQEIKRLADFAVITEEEKERQLSALYQSEQVRAISALQQLQKQELEVIKSAQTKFDEASSNPFFPEDKLAELKRNLDEARTAFGNTENEIIKTNEQFDKKQSGLNVALQQTIKTELQLAQAQRAQLEEQKALAKSRGDDTTELVKQIKATKQYEGELTRELHGIQAVIRTRPTWDSFFKDLISGTIKTGEAFRQMGQLFAQAIGDSVTAAVQGSESFGQAMEGILKAVLASLAGQAVVKVLEEVAKAASDFATAATLAADPFTAALAPGFVASAHAHLVAAAEWGAIGAGAAVGGAAIPSGSSGSSSKASTADNSTNIGSAGQAAQQPVVVQNVQHFASGGVVTKRQLAIVGDSPTGGDQDEAIIPLGDEQAKKRIAAAFLTAIVASQPGVTASERGRIISRNSELSEEITAPQIFTAPTRRAAAESVEISQKAQTRNSDFETRLNELTRLVESRPPQIIENHTHHTHVDMKVDGVISNDNLEKVAPRIAKKISDQVTRGKTRLRASTSFRVTKRG